MGRPIEVTFFFVLEQRANSSTSTKQNISNSTITSRTAQPKFSAPLSSTYCQRSGNRGKIKGITNPQLRRPSWITFLYPLEANFTPWKNQNGTSSRHHPVAFYSQPSSQNAAAMEPKSPMTAPQAAALLKAQTMVSTQYNSADYLRTDVSLKTVRNLNLNITS
jgi:hypothetical protein